MNGAATRFFYRHIFYSFIMSLPGFQNYLCRLLLVFNKTPPKIEKIETSSSKPPKNTLLLTRELGVLKISIRSSVCERKNWTKNYYENSNLINFGQDVAIGRKIHCQKLNKDYRYNKVIYGIHPNCKGGKMRGGGKRGNVRQGW